MEFFNEETVKAIRDLAKPEVIELPDDVYRAHVIVAGQVHTINKAGERMDQRHQFPTIEALAQMLDLDRDPQRARSNAQQIAVFVGAGEVKATPHYPLSQRMGQPGVLGSIYTVPLGLSREYKALQKLASGVGGKELWRLLVTDLAKCLDPALALLVSSLKHTSNTEAKAQISPTGVMDEAGAAASVNVQFGDGSNLRSVQLNWEWKGPVWDAWPELLTIKLRLEIDTSEGFTLIFHPVGMERAVQDHRARMVKWLRGRMESGPSSAAQTTAEKLQELVLPEPGEDAGETPALPSLAPSNANLLPVLIFEGELGL